MKKDQTISWRIYQELLANHVTPFLTACGFRPKAKAGDWFVLDEGDVYQEVSAIYDPYRGEDRGAVQIAVGVGLRSVAKALRDVGGVKMPPPRCLAALIGPLRTLMPRACSPAWEYIKPESDPCAVGQALVGDLRAYALPLFEQFSVLGNLMKAWADYTSHPFVDQYHIYALAMAHWMKGDREKAAGALKAAIARAEADGGSRLAEELREFAGKLAASTP